MLKGNSCHKNGRPSPKAVTMAWLLKCGAGEHLAFHLLQDLNGKSMNPDDAVRGLVALIGACRKTLEVNHEMFAKVARPIAKKKQHGWPLVKNVTVKIRGNGGPEEFDDLFKAEISRRLSTSCGHLVSTERGIKCGQAIGLLTSREARAILVPVIGAFKSLLPASEGFKEKID